MAPNNIVDKQLYDNIVKQAKKKFKTWPSMYASSWVTQQYKSKGGKYIGNKPSKKTGISRWFKEEWVQVEGYLNGKKRIQCGSAIKKTKACRPLIRVDKKTPITLPELLKIHKKSVLLNIAKKKQKDMNGRIYWKTATFTPSSNKSNSQSPKTSKNIKVKLTNSPKATKRYRITFEDGKTVDFGARGYSNYTIHKTPERMRNYVTRHGGKVPLSTKKETEPSKIHKKMLNVKSSSKEDCTINGIKSAGFWSRWLLWSEPSIKKAKSLITTKFKIKF